MSALLTTDPDAKREENDSTFDMIFAIIDAFDVLAGVVAASSIDPRTAALDAIRRLKPLLGRLPRIRWTRDLIAYAHLDRRGIRDEGITWSAEWEALMQRSWLPIRDAMADARRRK